MKISTVFATILAAGLATSASSATIISAVGATASSTAGAGDIDNTYNQNGLSAGYTSGVTDFDAYIATNPMHTLGYGGNEWFTLNGVLTATVIYDLGASMAISAFALWHEESSGFGFANLLTSTDGITYNALTTISPVAAVAVVDYPAQVFGFADTTFRYLKMDIGGCPSGAGNYQGCAIGEVAFRSGTTSPVPIPATGLLLIGALGGLITARRRRAAS